MLSTDRFAILTGDMEEYLEYESQRRGISKEDVYNEEIEAEERARKKLPSREEFRIFAQNSTPDPRYFCTDDDPF